MDERTVANPQDELSRRRLSERLSSDASTLTVVVPNFNHGHLIHEQLDAIFSQSRPATSVIIVDDASTDDSVSRIERLTVDRPEVTLIRKQVNGGALDAINEALSLTRTTHVTFLAADDCVLPGLFEKAVLLLDLHPAAAVCSARTRVEKGGRQIAVVPSIFSGPIARSGYLNPDRVRDLLIRSESWYVGCTAVYRTEMLRAEGGFRPELLSYADEFMFRVLALRHGACFVPEVLAVNHRFDAGYSSASTLDEARARRILYESSSLMTGAYASLFPEELVARANGRMLFRLACCQLDGFEKRLAGLTDAASPAYGRTTFLWVVRCTTWLLKGAYFLALRMRDLPRVGVARVRASFRHPKSR